MAFQIYHPEQAKAVQAVLFDMDGVLLDSEILYTRFWKEAAKSFGYPMTQEIALGMRSLNASLGQAYLEKHFGKGISYAALRAVRI